MRQTPLSELVAARLGLDLAALRADIVDQRVSGRDWRSIAADLTERSGRTVSHETVRFWLADEAREVRS